MFIEKDYIDLAEMALAPRGSNHDECGDFGRCMYCRKPSEPGDDQVSCPRASGLLWADITLDSEEWPAFAIAHFARAHLLACCVATALGIPAAYRPHEAFGVLRVLEFPSGAHAWIRDDWYAGQHDMCSRCEEHRTDERGTDVCLALAPTAGTPEQTTRALFALLLWASHPVDLTVTSDAHPAVRTGPHFEANELCPGLRIGELGSLIGLGPATPHRFPPRTYARKFLIYEAFPDHAAVLRSRFASDGGDLTVGEWLASKGVASRKRRIEKAIFWHAASVRSGHEAPPALTDLQRCVWELLALLREGAGSPHSG